MNAWAQFVWDRPSETDAHRDQTRYPYQKREADGAQACGRPRHLPKTNFVSQYAIGDKIVSSLELLARSRRLLEESRILIVRTQMRLLMYHSSKSIQ